METVVTLKLREFVDTRKMVDTIIVGVLNDELNDLKKKWPDTDYDWKHSKNTGYEVIDKKNPAVVAIIKVSVKLY